MEITRRFIKFLDELEEPTMQEKHLTLELQDNLQSILQRLSKFDFNCLKRARSLNDLQKFEKSLVGDSTRIYKKLKKTMEAISVLHLFVTNFSLNCSNIYQFLTAYCQTIFECGTISLISSHSNSVEFPKLIDGTEISDEDTLHEIIKTLDEIMADKIIYSLGKNSSGTFERYLRSKNYAQNIVIKITENSNQFYLIMHFTLESPFICSYLKGKYHEIFPLTFKIIKEAINLTDITCNKNVASFLEKLTALKFELIQLHQSYFLSFIASELRTFFNCETVLVTAIEAKENHRVTAMENEKKSIQIIFANDEGLEIQSNFAWDKLSLNKKLSELWQKLQKPVKAELKTTLDHIGSEDLVMEFNKKGELIYQSKPVEDPNHKTIIEIKNILNDPASRSYGFVFSKSMQILETIKKYLAEMETSEMLFLRKEGAWEDVSFEFFVKKKENNDKVEGFTITFKGRKRVPLRRLQSARFNTTLGSILDGFVNSEEVRPAFQRRQKRILTAKDLNQNFILHEKTDINILRKTIISEYLPEEFDTEKPHECISLVKKGTIEIISKTAFDDDLPYLNKKVSNSSWFSRDIDSYSNIRPLEFCPEIFRPKKSDKALLENWSFDSVNLEDDDEKSRFVWVMLDEFDLAVLCEFISKARDKYSIYKNAFHNYDHGVTVMHGAYYILKHIPTKFTSLVNLGVLIAAFCHDLGHTGRTNMFEVNTMSRLAIRYHDKSVLEQHHAAMAFKILTQEISNIFANIKLEDYKQLRKLIISNILATDMKVHFEMMSSFKDLQARIEAAGENKFCWNDDDVIITTNMITHCSDLCGPAKSFSAAYKWSLRVNHEFTIQVREEEILGIPVTPYFRDLEKPNVMAKQEIAFISFMIKPLWESFNKFMSETMQFAVDNIESNLQEWNRILEDAMKIKEEDEEGNTVGTS